MNGHNSASRFSLRGMPALALLYVSFRLVMFLAYQPILTEEGELGIGAGGDRLFHFELAALAADGKLPFRDWWSEYPPFFPALSTGLYLLLGEQVNYSNWSFLLGMLMLAFEAGNLFLLRGIGRQLYGEEDSLNLAWVYALSAAPAIFLWWNFDSMLNFFFLLGIYYLLKGRISRAALALAAGILVKFLPALLFGTALRFRRPETSLRVALLCALPLALVYLPLLAINAQLTTYSWRAQYEKPSSQTIWALLDGNYATGIFGSAADRLSQPNNVEIRDSNPARAPNEIRLAVAAGLGLWAFARTRRFDQRGFVAFAGLSVLIFYLQAQAWSPQWATLIIALTLLALPNWRGLLATIALTLLAFVEYPFLWSRTGDLDPPGQMSGDLFLPWALILLLRTGLLVGLALAFYQVLREKTGAAPLKPSEA